MKNIHVFKENIYITSDEKLPYDSAIFHTGAFYHRDFGGDVHIINKDTHYPNPNFCSRIILTTDESLFKYGVQAIDDDFLEWFIKNPSYEEIKILRCPIEGLYTIDLRKLIPKEELQQERSYSEEDMMDYSNYRLLIKKALNPKEWFEQFKNK